MTTLLFDVCHTLYKSNTTFDFLAFYFGDDDRYQKLARKRRSLLNRMLSKLGMGRDYRPDLIALLAGESESILRERAAHFVAGLQEIEPTMVLLRSALAEGQ